MIPQPTFKAQLLGALHTAVCLPWRLASKGGPGAIFLMAIALGAGCAFLLSGISLLLTGSI